jgi:hypothetical protein
MSFVSWLDAVGHDFKVGLDKILPWAEGAGETAVAIFAPQLGPVFNATVAAVATVEQKFSAMGQQTGSGVQKLAEATTIVGPLIAQALTDAGKTANIPAVQGYINAVVSILNASPAPAPKA